MRKSRPCKVCQKAPVYRTGASCSPCRKRAWNAKNAEHNAALQRARWAKNRLPKLSTGVVPVPVPGWGYVPA